MCNFKNGDDLKIFLNKASDHQNIINFLIFESLNHYLFFINSYFVIVGKN